MTSGSEIKEVKKKPDGGPAFPVNPIHFAEAPALSGLTVRQWYAGKALQGQLAAPNLRDNSREGIAREAFKYADAMIEADVK